MSKFGFEIKTSRDFLEKLKQECEEFQKNRTSSRVAINCAMTAWHLTDWVYNEFKEYIKSDFSNRGKFQEHIQALCPSLEVMQDISNGSKHFIISQYTPSVEDTDLHKGDFGNDFSRDFNISELIIQMKNGEKLYFITELINSHIFWLRYFNSTVSLYERKAGNSQ